jgi:hypothetical protein
MSRIDTSTDMGSEKQIETAPIISLSPWFLHMSVKMHYTRKYVECLRGIGYGQEPFAVN